MIVNGKRQQTKIEYVRWVCGNIRRELHDYFNHDPYEFDGGQSWWARKINRPKIHWWQRPAKYVIVYVQAKRHRIGWNGPSQRLSLTEWRDTSNVSIISVDEDHFTCKVKVSRRIKPDSRHDVAALLTYDAFHGIETDANAIFTYTEGGYCKTFNNYLDNYGPTCWDDPYLGPVFVSVRNAQTSIS